MRYFLCLGLSAALVTGACSPTSQSPGPVGPAQVTASPASASASPGTSPAPDPGTNPNPGPGASPTAQPTAGPVIPTAMPDPSSPSASSAPFHALAAALSLSPERLTLNFQGHQQLLLVTAKDASGQNLDPAALRLSWSSSKPLVLAVDSQGRVTALSDSGDAEIRVVDAISGLSASIWADIQRRSGGGGGGGGSTPTNQLTATTLFEGLEVEDE